MLPQIGNLLFPNSATMGPDWSSLKLSAEETMDSNQGIVAPSEILAAFQSKIEAKTAQVGIIGLGYVGLPLALLFARNGFAVSGFDLDSTKVTMLQVFRRPPGEAARALLGCDLPD